MFSLSFLHTDFARFSSIVLNDAPKPEKMVDFASQMKLRKSLSSVDCATRGTDMEKTFAIFTFFIGGSSVEEHFRFLLVSIQFVYIFNVLE